VAPLVLEPSNAILASRGGRILLGRTQLVGVVEPDPEQAGRVERLHRPTHVTVPVSVARRRRDHRETGRRVR
jgi:hypothetical protein